jgi:hypothetical protein
MTMRVRTYVLDFAGNPVLEPDMAEWGRWLVECADQRIVARDEIGDVTVSTVFLGLDHGWGEGDAPVLWETMAFRNGKALDDPMWRYTSLKAAIAGHAKAVASVSGIS